MMRVIAGIYKGRKLKTLHSKHVRPITDKIKEALFNIVHQRLAGAVFLDLYAGTGSVGIEALSRGAKYIYFVDMSRASTCIIKENIARLPPQLPVTVLSASVQRSIDMLSEQGLLFDIIFLDPPYKKWQGDDLLRIFNAGILAKGGIIICKHARAVSIEAGPYVCLDTKQYGLTALTFLQGTRHGTPCDLSGNI